MALLFLGGACSPSSNPKPGAPVLTTLTIVEPNGTPHGTRWDVTKDTKTCPTGVTEGMDCDPTAVTVCELDKNVVCHCDGTDMCTPTKGSLNCTYAPGSMVVATFDRILDTTPFDGMMTVATLTADPTSAATAATDYTSSGSSTGLVFTQWSAPAFTGGYFADIVGPTIAMTGSPAIPTDATVTFALDPNLVQSKDKKSFVGDGPLADGKIAFKTSSFSASISVPAPPPPMDMGGSDNMMMCPDAGAMMMSPMDGGDASSQDGASDGGSEDGAGADGGAADTGTAADAGTMAEAGASQDAGMTTPPSTDVPADMNMGAITITFTNPVDATVIDPDPNDMTVLKHIKITEDGTVMKTADLVLPDPMKDFPTTTVTITPATMWAAGKTYNVTVDKTTADVLGKQLGQDVSQSFTMAK